MSSDRYEMSEDEGCDVFEDCIYNEWQYGDKEHAEEQIEKSLKLCMKGKERAEKWIAEVSGGVRGLYGVEAGIICTDVLRRETGGNGKQFGYWLLERENWSGYVDVNEGFKKLKISRWDLIGRDTSNINVFQAFEEWNTVLGEKCNIEMIMDKVGDVFGEDVQDDMYRIYRHLGIYRDDKPYVLEVLLHVVVKDFDWSMLAYNVRCMSLSCKIFLCHCRHDPTLESRRRLLPLKRDFHFRFVSKPFCTPDVGRCRQWYIWLGPGQKYVLINCTRINLRQGRQRKG